MPIWVYCVMTWRLSWRMARLAGELAFWTYIMNCALPEYHEPAAPVVLHTGEVIQ